MKRLVVLFALAAVMVTSCTAVQGSWDDGINIIPAPVSITENEGSFTFRSGMTLSAEGEEAMHIADMFISKLSAEGYRLSVTPDHILAEGVDGAGLFYAVQTLLQLLPAEVADLCYDPEKDLLWVADSEAFKLFLFSGDASQCLAAYDLSGMTKDNPESVCVDHVNNCVWVADDSEPSKLYKISFNDL